MGREGNGTPLQYSCLENPMDGGAWWAAVHGVAKSRTRLKSLSSSSKPHGWNVKWFQPLRKIEVPYTFKCGFIPWHLTEVDEIVQLQNHATTFV